MRIPAGQHPGTNKEWLMVGVFTKIMGSTIVLYLLLLFGEHEVIHTLVHAARWTRGAAGEPLLHVAEVASVAAALAPHEQAVDHRTAVRAARHTRGGREREERQKRERSPEDGCQTHNLS